MTRNQQPDRSSAQFWFRVSAGTFLAVLIVTLPMYSAGLFRILLLAVYLTLLLLVRAGKIGPRR